MKCERCGRESAGVSYYVDWAKKELVFGCPLCMTTVKGSEMPLAEAPEEIRRLLKR